MSEEKELAEYLSGFVTHARKTKFSTIIAQRTRHITVALEDIYQPHNASAVLRTCDCFGIQDVHIIENKNAYSVNPDVALGSSQWLTMHRYSEKESNTIDCIQSLKKKGYKIIATTPHNNDCNISDLNINDKICLFFGTEKEGISEDTKKHADGFVKIPMHGFTESFNISVSAAICLYELTKRLRTSAINWQLTESEKNELLLSWVRNTIHKVDLIEKDFKAKKKNRK
jgi:tRNA (guanosine-2'-O-)-methyltransferase